MFAAVIKNTILIFFVICIGYFLVDNHINDKVSERLQWNNKNTSSSGKKTTQPKTPTKNPLNTSETPMSEENTTVQTKPMAITIDPEIKELYGYVYNDMKASDDLTAMYVNTEVREVEKDLQTICEEDNSTKLKSMCSDPIKEHHDNVSYDNIQVKPISDQSMYNFVDKHI
jgi:hypothetical protein